MFAEFGYKKGNGWVRNISIKEEEINEYRERYGNIDVYTTYFRYPKPGKPDRNTEVIGDMVFDFDSEKDVEEARNDAVGVIENLRKEFDIDPDTIRIVFSGKKGYHIIVPYQTFNVEADKDLDKTYKRIAEGFYKAGYKTIDMKMYQKNRFLRLPNSKHNDTGFYAIQLTFNELKSLDTDRIMSLAAKPKNVVYKKPRPSEKAKELYNVNRERMDKPITFSSETVFDVTKLRNVCPAVDNIYNILQTGSSKLNHEQNIFLSKVLIPFGKQGEKEIHRIIKKSEGKDYDERYTSYQINYSRNGRCPPACSYVRENWHLCDNCNGNTDPLSRMKNRDRVIKRIEEGPVTYELLHPDYAVEEIFSYHISEDFVLQPVFCPTIVKIKKGKTSVEEETTKPFVLFSNGKEHGIYPADSIISVNGKRYKIKTEPEMLPTMPTPGMVMQFLNGKKVDGKKIWQDVKKYISTYVDFIKPETYTYYTAYLMATHFYSAYNAFPYNHFHGEHNSGKSQAQRVGYRLAFHGEYVKKITSSQIFRTVEATGCSFFIEEAEHLWSADTDPELQQILNAGYQKDGVARITDKNTHRSLRFNVYSPKSFSSIGEIYPVLRSRTVQNLMLRTKTDKGDKDFDEKLAAGIRDDLYLLRLQDGTMFAENAKHGVFEDLHLTNRDRELYFPLLQVTERYAAKEELEELKGYIRDCIENEKTEYVDSNAAMVYMVLRDMINEDEVWVLVTDVRENIVRTDPHAYRLKIVDRDGHESEEFRILESSSTARRFSTQRIGYIMKNMGFIKKKYTRLGVKRLVTLKRLLDLESRYMEYGGSAVKGEYFVEEV